MHSPFSQTCISRKLLVSFWWLLLQTPKHQFSWLYWARSFSVPREIHFIQPDLKIRPESKGWWWREDVCNLIQFDLEETFPNICACHASCPVREHSGTFFVCNTCHLPCFCTVQDHCRLHSGIYPICEAANGYTDGQGRINSIFSKSSLSLFNPNRYTLLCAFFKDP